MDSCIPLRQLVEADTLPKTVMVLGHGGSHWRIDVSEALDLISPQIWRYLAIESLRSGRPVLELLSHLAIRWPDRSDFSGGDWRSHIRLEGELPSGFYGAVLADGSAHT
jgi:hypothetical protein